MANKPPAFQFYVKDWLSSESVVVMTAEQRGWYIQLLCHAWNGEPIATLPTDDRKLQALAGAGDSWATDKQAVLDCFEVDGDRMVNRRLAAQYQELQEFHKSKSEAGRKGNEARWGKDRKGIAEQSLSDEDATRTGIPNDRPSSATSSTTATSTVVAAVEPTGQTGQVQDQDPNQSREDDEVLVRFWAANLSSVYKGKTLTPALLAKASVSCFKYLSTLPAEKRYAIAKAAHGAAAPVKTEVSPELAQLVEGQIDVEPETCATCGYALNLCDGHPPDASQRFENLDVIEIPKSKAFEIED